MLQHTDRGRHLRRSPAGTTQKDDKVSSLRDLGVLSVLLRRLKSTVNKVSSLRDLRRCCANDTGSFRATKL
ncbi:MAG: hypothetical protein LBU62_00680 [Bacteroidales bacterium]|nr:hypothetical protein [Bacteroidales bacterium]